ncbi:MAG: ATP-binding protein, partial [Opitutae bacterium]|nr:ATP-binding protein [Opitutae bacterium]
MNKTDNEPNVLWDSLKNNLCEAIPADTYRVWFNNVRLGRFERDSLEIVAPNEFSAIWIRDNYMDVIRREAKRVAGRTVDVNLYGEPELEEDSDSDSDSISENRRTSHSSRKSKRQGKNPDAIARSLGLNPKNTFSNFVVGAGSELAHAACIAVSNAPAHAYNPLFIYGETGLGKTHLMHAVAQHALKRDPEAKICYLSCEKFTNEFIRGIQENTLTKFRTKYRNVDFLLIDD